jgi:hypothetical protein
MLSWIIAPPAPNMKSVDMPKLHLSRFRSWFRHLRDYMNDMFPIPKTRRRRKALLFFMSVSA